MILFTNKNWNITKISETEIKIDNNWSCCYAYLSKCGTKLVADKKIYPKYIEQKAVKLANKHIKSIYNEV